jgi:putative DNA primase/helicase
MFIDDFKHALNSAGISCKDNIIADGQLHRFHIEGDKSGKKNGWYVFYSGNIPAGAYGCWKRGINETWCAVHQKSLSVFERQLFQANIHKAKCLQDKEKQSRYQAAKRKAQAIWNQSAPAPDSHMYLVKKGVKNHGLRLYKNALVVPVMDGEGEIHSLQFIDEHGQKRFLSGGRKKDCYYAIIGAGESFLLAEGYATAATLYEVTGHSVAVTFDAGNMKTVASAIREKHPDFNITVCADNDAANSENTGLIKAREAAISIGAKLAIPPCVGDFNDYYFGGAS